jgi:glycosyltransferase involved in cell wall biosynthesis
MGSDVKSSGLWRMIIRFFAKYIWGSTVVKSTDMMISMKLTSKDVHVIPNGVDLDLFVPMDRNECRAKIGWGNASKIVLFAADPSRMEKNFDLAHNSMLHLGYDDVELKVVFGVEQKEMPQFYNAADVLLLTSKWEGSPNVIKEAMACTLPS